MKCDWYFRIHFTSDQIELSRNLNLDIGLQKKKSCGLKETPYREYLQKGG